MAVSAQVGAAWGSSGGTTVEIANAVEELTGTQPRLVRLPDLCGPNETIQVLLNPEGWWTVAKWVGLIYGAELIRLGAKASWKAIGQKLSSSPTQPDTPLGRLVWAIRAARHAHTTVVFGFPRTTENRARHIGVEIHDADPDEIARIIAVLAVHGEELLAGLDAFALEGGSGRTIIYGQNSDCSARLAVTDDGAIYLHASISDDGWKTRREVLYDLRSKCEV